MDIADEKISEVKAATGVENIPARPRSGDPNPRRAVVNADNFVDLIVAGRKKNKSKFIPSSDQPNTRRPRRIIMPDKDFKLVFGAAAGTLHDYAERPEIEIAVIRMVNLNAIPTAELTKPSLDEYAEPTPLDKDNQIASSSIFDLSMELSAPAVGPDDTNFRLLYDDTRCAFVLTHNIEDRMLTVLRERRLGVKTSLSSIIEMKEEEQLNTTTTTNVIKADFIPSSSSQKNKHEDDDEDDVDEHYDEQSSKQIEDKQHQDLQIGIPETSLSIATDNFQLDTLADGDSSWQLCLETSFFLYGKGKGPKAYYTIDSRRQRLWRRFIRLYFDPILADQAHFAAMQERLAKEVERKALAALSGLEVTPTESEDESSVASASTVGSKRGGRHKHHKHTASVTAETGDRTHHKKKAAGSSNKAAKKGEENAAQEKKKEMPRTALMKRMASKKAR